MNPIGDSYKVKLGHYELAVPSEHILLRLADSHEQPYRDLGLGMSARFITEKYPDATVLDIGANIGDTAAIIATHARPKKLILVEPSELYFTFLTRNINKFPGNVVCVKQLVSGTGRQVAGSLVHWEGTAYFHSDECQPRQSTVKLADLVDDSTRLVKIDTDGSDFSILVGALPFLKEREISLFFENEVRTQVDFMLANTLYSSLLDIGYTHFVVWDDRGLHVTSTQDISVLRDLNRHLFELWRSIKKRSICNYDILCLKSFDSDIYEQVSDWFRSLALVT